MQGLARIVGTLVLSIGLAACGGDDDAASADAGPDARPPASYQLVRQGEPGAFLAVSGTTASDLWLSGGKSTNPGPPTVLHYDGSAWSRPETGQDNLDLWWVFDAPGPDVYFGGSAGKILRNDGAFTEMTTPSSIIKVFGMWGAAADDLWAVGNNGGASGAIWRYDGAAWTTLAVPAEVEATWKVHGRAADDVWISGSAGQVLHWDGDALERFDLGTEANLFSITTTADRVIAVGGAGQGGEIYEYDGAAWAAVESGNPYNWRGACSDGTDAYAVGELGTIGRRGAGGWTVGDTGLTIEDFHGCWVDPDGGLWIVGGKFDGSPTEDGVLIYYGSETIPAIE